MHEWMFCCDKKGINYKKVEEIIMRDKQNYTKLSILTLIWFENCIENDSIIIFTRFSLLREAYLINEQNEKSIVEFLVQFNHLFQLYILSNIK